MPWGFFTSTGKEKLTEEEQNPSGMIVQFGGSTIPIGWLSCDGTEKAISSYPDLYKAVGTNYGALTDGAGSTAGAKTHFRVPDLRGRIPVGIFTGSGDGSSGLGSFVFGSAMSSKAIGSWRGAESVTLSASESGLPAHDHTISSSNHSHTISVSANHNHGYGYNNVAFKYQSSSTVLQQASTFGPYFAYTSYATPGCSIPGGKSGVTSTQTTTGESATDSHTNVQPSLVVNFIIKV